MFNMSFYNCCFYICLVCVYHVFVMLFCIIKRSQCYYIIRAHTLIKSHKTVIKYRIWDLMAIKVLNVHPKVIKSNKISVNS